MFRKKESAEKENRGREHYADKIVKHRLHRIYRGILIIVVIAAVAAALWISEKNRIYTDYEVTGSYERTVAASAKTIMLGNHVLTYSNDGASCCDAKGKAVWNETFEMQNPIVEVSNSAIAIGDYNGRNIYVMNEQGVLGEITTNLPIRALSVSDDGVVAAVLDGTDITWIYLYNSKGEAPVTFMTTMSQSGYPLDVALSPNSNLAAISYLSTEEGKIKSSIAFYNFGEVGQNEIDNYMSGYDYQAVAPYVSFMASELAFAVADDRLMFYEGGQKPVSKSEVLLEGEVQSIYHNEEYVALVTYDATGAHKYMLDVYDSDGVKKLSQGFDIQYKNIILKGENIYIYSETECAVYHLSGIEKFSGTLGEEISLLIPGESIKKMTLVSSNRIDVLELK